jgi:hypothetical protein
MACGFFLDAGSMVLLAIGEVASDFALTKFDHGAGLMRNQSTDLLVISFTHGSQLN